MRRVRRLKLKEIMATRLDENGEPYSANAVAKAVGVSHNTILSYMRDEGREPSHSFVKNLCAFFRVSEDEMVEWEELTPELWPGLQPHPEVMRA
jgi:transcriptional regulator with XRE-family HTH domain